ncbi:hypothetical protein FHG87_002876 [Trinorchestia longiramus]|nr:hypothetical protein FHG87_002876 [Trinorchestia longiramus]
MGAEHNPLVLVGPVLMGCGLLVLILSIEVCIRRHQFYAKNRGLLMDDDELLEKTPAEGFQNPTYNDPVYSSPAEEGVSKNTVDSWQATPRPRPPARNQTMPVLVTPRKEISGSSMSLPQAEKSPARNLMIASGSPRSLPVPSNPNDSSSSQEQLELILTPKAL